MRSLLIALVTGLFLSCHHKTVPVVTTSETVTEKILFLAYEVTRDSTSGKISTKVLYQKTTDGFVKAGSVENATADSGNWQIIVTDKKDIPVETLLIENPLHKKLEYVGADGRLGMKDVWLNRAEIAVRMNYKKAMDNVSLQEIGTNKNNRLIFNHSILLTNQ